MEDKTIYALGFFDGVHLGHQALLAQCRRMADDLGCQAGVVTFLGHPDTLVSGVTPPLINTPQDRERLLKQYGMDTIVALPFDRELMSMAYEDFFWMLVGRFGAAGLVCGHDFRFGAGGRGNAQMLSALCREAGIPCGVIAPQKVEGITVSSTYIRTLIARGEMGRAAEFLGHPHVFTGTVVSGKGLGRTLGVPTANLLVPEGVQIPGFGVYICRAWIDGAGYPAVTNVGVRPTVSGQNVTVEPWILDFAGDLYGKELTLEFHQFLRPERKFPSLEELRLEIQKNREQTRKYFENR